MCGTFCQAVYSNVLYTSIVQIFCFFNYYVFDNDPYYLVIVDIVFLSVMLLFKDCWMFEEEKHIWQNVCFLIK